MADLTADAYRHVATVDCRCLLSPPVGSYATPRACRSMIASTPFGGASCLVSAYATVDLSIYRSTAISDPMRISVH